MRNTHNIYLKLFLGIKSINTVYFIVALLTILSFFPVIYWSRNSGSTVVDVYGEAGGYMLSYPRRHLKLMRDQIIERDKLIAQLKNEIEVSKTYFNKENYDKIQQKTRKLIEDYIEMQTKSQTLEEIASQSQSILKKKDTSTINEVTKLNATYIKIFAEMKKKLNSLQIELSQQVEISEKLEKELRDKKINCEKKQKQSTKIETKTLPVNQQIKPTFPNTKLKTIKVENTLHNDLDDDLDDDSEEIAVP